MHIRTFRIFVLSSITIMYVIYKENMVVEIDLLFTPKQAKVESKLCFLLHMYSHLCHGIKKCLFCCCC